jgi:3-(3-hydroxy-phenyl)propionate hydroxylase
MDIEADVAVVGAGPCGLTLANLLGTHGVVTAVMDREAGALDHPRAVAVDDESLRSFQAAGLAEEILDDCIQNAPIRYHDSRGRVLAHVGPSARPYGWPRRNLFLQPFMEATLRRGLDRFGHVTLYPETDVDGLSQDDAGVRLTARRDGREMRLRARFVVGADGGRSFVRGAAGITLRGRTAPSQWLVVDVAEDAWDAPYSAVYCHPRRPSMTIPLPYGHRRFEFKVLPGESEERIAEPDSVQALLTPFYRRRALPMPEVRRARVYWHHSRVASRFQSGAVFLAGDAAHLQPPFFGQGMNSGIRDATNLAWKLAAVTAGRSGTGLLDTYDAERRGHAEAMVSFATRVGRMYQPRNRATETVRDALFRGAQKIPGARDYILQMKYKPAPRYGGGVVVGAGASTKDALVGRLFGQPWVLGSDGRRRRLDDVLGSSMAVLGLTGEPSEFLSATSIEGLAEAGALLVRVSPPRAGRRGSGAASGVEVPQEQAKNDRIEIQDIDGAFRDLRLDRPDDEVIILRPDRYVAATCRTADLDSVVGDLCSILRG